MFASPITKIAQKILNVSRVDPSQPFAQEKPRAPHFGGGLARIQLTEQDEGFAKESVHGRCNCRGPFGRWNSA